eukprot:scaffold39407_cov18-Tisochrysis_lutea.AAC.1
MQVDLIGHSAGGWLGRAFIGDPDFFPTGTLQQQQQLDTSGSAEISSDAVGGAQRVSAALPSLPPLTMTLPQAWDGAQQVVWQAARVSLLMCELAAQKAQQSSILASGLFCCKAVDAERPGNPCFMHVEHVMA